MKQLLPSFIFLFLLCNLSLEAQNLGCDGGDRYINDLFTSTAAPTTIQFGSNTTVNNQSQDLFMDIYEPDGDGLAERPVIMMAFGGSFIGGDRGTVASYCREYAQKGYVTVAIDYRIYDKPLFPLPDSTDMLEVVVGSISDMKAAIRQLRSDADNGNPYRIDPNRIIVGGISAGAIVAVHTAYLQDSDNLPAFLADEVAAQGGFEGNSNNSTLGYSSEVQGVLNYYGALYRAEYMNAGEAPISSIHGTADDIVPYGFDFAQVCLGLCIEIISMQGSSIIHDEAIAEGIPSKFISVLDGGHGTFSSVWYDSMRVNSARLMHDEVLCNGFVGTQNLQEDVSKYVVAFPNPADENITLDFNNLNEVYDLTIMDNTGRVLKSFTNQVNNQMVIHREDFASGFYVINVRFHNADYAPVNKRIVFKPRF